MKTPTIICYCGSLRVAIEAFKKAEYQSVVDGNIALLPCCMFVDIEREYGAESDYKQKADDLHKRKIDIADKVVVLNVGGYIGNSTRSEIEYAESIGKSVEYLEPWHTTKMAIAYLEAEGIDVDSLVSEGVSKIKQMEAIIKQQKGN